MSRIGKKPVIIPNSVTATVVGSTVTVKGPKGSLTWTANPLASITLVEMEGGKAIEVAVPHPEKVDESALWGTVRAVIANLVKGVTEGFSKTLEINGVGFRASATPGKLVLTIGFSHDIDYLLPEGTTATVEKNVITVSGIDKQVVGKVASEIRALKKPEPYLGKGIKYTDEVIRRKAGKSAKTAE